MAKGIEITQDGIGDLLRGMLGRFESIRGFLDRVIYPEVVQLQRERWMTENASQGEVWAPLKPEYAKYKLKKFSAYPGAGTKLLIATGALVDSMTGDGKDHWKLVTDTRLEVGSLVAYAKYVNQARDIVGLRDEERSRFMKQILDYIVRSIQTP